jgi:1-acyl-sn-glycerol-3-phosphate acyltransferase
LGQACALVGILFVNRKNAESRERSKRELRRHYNNGIHIALFAEGTTTDGTDVLPFKKSVFEMGLDVVPCAIKYRTDTGFNPAWHGDQTLWPHLVEMFNHKKVEGRVRLFPKMSAQDYPDFTAYQNAVRDTIRGWVVAPWGEEDRVA